MDVVYERCCGLDLHRDTIVACLLTPGRPGKPQAAVRTFGTMTADVQALGDWLADAGCTHVAMESTGVYWQPVYNLLEARFTLLLVNAQHVKQVPGRKTDVRDCAWLAELLRVGLLQPSFVPSRAQRELRELVRYRTRLVEERAAEVNRLQKTLEGANLKLGAVASSIVGVSGRAILQALLDGVSDPAVLAELAVGKLRQKLPALRRALAGQLRPHQRFLLRCQLTHIEQLEAQLADLDAEVHERLREAEDTLARLDSIPGVGPRTAELILAEVGSDLTPFPSAKHLASWAGLCPGNHESAGKRQSGRTRKGNGYLRSGLVEAAKAARRVQGSVFAALYRRVAAKRGAKRATLAVAHRLLTVAYCLLRDGTSYEEREPAAAVVAQTVKRERRLIADLQRRGYVVTPPADQRPEATVTHGALAPAGGG